MNFMITLQLIILQSLLMSPLIMGQSVTTLGDTRISSYSNTQIGFSYAPPAGLKDSTQQSVQNLKARAAKAAPRKTLILLFSMTSGPDDMAPTWHSLAIEMYPREALDTEDDREAEVRMSAWVAGRRVLGSPQLVTIAGRQFTFCEFEQQDIAVRKHAAIYTTVRRRRLLSFAFSANSPQELEVLKDRMKTLRFF